MQQSASSRPSAPGLSVVAVNLTTFNFTISPPSVGSQCVLNYTITTSGDADINVDAPTTVTESGFDLCSNTYNFTVVANTLTGPGETSRIINPDLLTPMLDLNFSEFSVMITGMAPENSPSFADSTVSIQRSSPKSSSCEESVLNQMTSGSSPVTVMETLNCRYAGCNVTYCLQFSTEECMSIVVINTTELPSLLSSPLEVTSSTDSISLRWDVNEQANCEGVDGLTINVTISEGATAIRTEEADFADGTITFEFISARDYTCSVTVVFGSESIESSQAACGITAATTTTDDSGVAPIGPVVGGVVGGAAVLIIVVAVVVVLILVLKKSNDKGNDETATELKPAQTYRPVADDKPYAAPADLYVVPSSIEQVASGPAGYECALVSKKTKKEGVEMTDSAGVTGDGYSVPYKSKKPKNAGNNPRCPPPRAPPPPAPAQAPPVADEPPVAVEHVVGPNGDLYAVVSKKTKKKGVEMTDSAGVTGDMYSVPDKSKKQKNDGTAGPPPPPETGTTYAALNLAPANVPPSVEVSTYKVIDHKATSKLEWEKGPDPDASLDSNMMVIQIQEAVSHWREYGKALGLPQETIHQIEQFELEDLASMVEVAEAWLQLLREKKFKPTWKAVAVAMEQIGLKKLGQSIGTVYTTGQLPITEKAINEVPAGACGDNEAPPPLPPKLEDSDDAGISLPPKPQPRVGSLNKPPPRPPKVVSQPSAPPDSPKSSPPKPSEATHD